MIKKREKIFLAGHRGLVGSAILGRLIDHGYKNIIIIDKSNLDLTNQQKVFNFLKKKKTKSSNNSCSKSWRDLG